MLSHLARRGVEYLSQADILEKQANAFAELKYEMPVWGVGMLALTTVSFVFLAALIEYTVQLLIVNLAIVESPTSATVSIYKPVSTNDDPDAPLEKRDPYQDIEIERATVFSKPVTSSLRTTIKHLHSIGGFRSRWRGIKLFGYYSAFMGMVHFFVMLVPISASPLLASIVAPLAAARLHCAWTHTTISMPSSKTLKERLVPRSSWRHLLGPTLLKTAAVEITALAFVGMIALSANRINDLVNEENPACAPFMMWLAAPFVVGIVAFSFFVVPASAVLVRIETSLLPEDEDTVVPIDRTFGSRVDEATGTLKVVDAWKSFTNEAWARVMKVYVKYTFISLGLLAFFFHAIIFQLWFIMGDNLIVLLESGFARLETLRL